MFPWPPSQETLLPAGASLAALLLIAVLLRVARLGEALARQDDLAERLLAGRRGEVESLRATLLGVERALSVRVAETRMAMEHRLGDFSARTARDQAEARVQFERKLREMADTQARHIGELHRGVNETLHQAVEQQMQGSFARVLEQFAEVQKAVGDVQAVAAQIGDLKRVFANVRTRGTWGEGQLRALLDDLLPDGYVVNARLRADRTEVVEFALRMPGRGEAARLLPLDAKFPLADYERLLNAGEAGDAEGERLARRALEARLRLEARKIAEKYVVPPATTDFAVMYLPTDGLYAEAARMPGLIDDLGRMQVVVMGPSLLPGLLRTVRLGYVTLALEERAGQIGRLLGATRQELLHMDEVLERLARGAGTMSRTIEDARRRTRAMGRRLRDIDLPGAEEAERVPALHEVEEP